MHYINYLPIRWRFIRLLLVLLLSLSLLTAYLYLRSRPSYSIYDALASFEVSESRRFIRNEPDNKYVLFRQLQGAGFNNQAQEILLFHHLALLTSRVYAYQPFIWRPRGANAGVPLSAFMPGVTRNSITAAVFDEACSPEVTKHISIRVTDGVLWDYTKELLNAKDRCIIVDDWILNWNFLASPALHDVWPNFQKYLARHFRWSDPIKNIVARAQAQLNLQRDPDSPGDPYIALHFRRGDFEAHCHILAADHTGFTTWATLPILHPRISAPALDPSNNTSVMEHCYPDLPRVANIISTLAHDKPHIRTLHVLHDGAWDHPLVYYQLHRLKALLPAGWRVTHSAQVKLGWGESDWGVTADVELARRAEAFIGNGYSSLSTQVIALRLGSDGGRVEDIALL